MACGWDCSARDAARAAYEAAQAAYEAAVARYEAAQDLMNQLLEEEGKLNDIQSHFDATQPMIADAGDSIWANSEENMNCFNSAVECLHNYGEKLAAAKETVKSELDNAIAERDQAQAERDAALQTYNATPCYPEPCPEDSGK
jgi:hypothetical protein